MILLWLFVLGAQGAIGGAVGGADAAGPANIPQVEPPPLPLPPPPQQFEPYPAVEPPPDSQDQDWWRHQARRRHLWFKVTPQSNITSYLML